MANAVVLWVIVNFCVTSVNTKDTFSTRINVLKVLAGTTWGEQKVDANVDI